MSGEDGSERDGSVGFFMSTWSFGRGRVSDFGTLLRSAFEHCVALCVVIAGAWFCIVYWAEWHGFGAALGSSFIGAIFLVLAGVWLQCAGQERRKRARALDWVWREAGERLGLEASLTRGGRRLSGKVEGVNLVATDDFSGFWSRRWLPRLSGARRSARVEVTVGGNDRLVPSRGSWHDVPDEGHRGAGLLGSMPPPMRRSAEEVLWRDLSDPDPFRLEIAERRLRFAHTTFKRLMGSEPGREEGTSSLRLVELLTLCSQLVAFTRSDRPCGVGSAEAAGCGALRSDSML
jgi:hypothetical protein